MPEGATVGLGGSVTIGEIDLIDALRAKGHMIYDHWDPSLSQEDGGYMATLHGLTDNIANRLASSLAIGYGVVGDSALSTLYRHSFSVGCGYPGGNQYNR